MATEAGVEKDTAWQFIARVYREAAKKAEEAGFDGGPSMVDAEFFEGTRYIDGEKKTQNEQQ